MKCLVLLANWAQYLQRVLGISAGPMAFIFYMCKHLGRLKFVLKGEVCFELHISVDSDASRARQESCLDFAVHTINISVFPSWFIGLVFILRGLVKLFGGNTRQN